MLSNIINILLHIDKTLKTIKYMLGGIKMNEEIYVARLEKLKKQNERYTLKLYLIDLDSKISIDIHDELIETLGIADISSQKLIKIYEALPKRLKVFKNNNQWQLLNEGQIISNSLSNIYLSK